MKLQEKISTRSAKLTPGEFATVRVKRSDAHDLWAEAVSN